MKDYSELKRLAEAARFSNASFVTLRDFSVATSPVAVLALIAEVEELRKQCPVADDRLAFPPPTCRQVLAASGKAYPKSSCSACGQFSPRWKECDMAINASLNQETE